MDLLELIKKAEGIKRVTAKFGEETAEAAKWVACRMEEAGVSCLKYDGGTICLNSRRTSAGYYETLTITDKTLPSDYYSGPVESGDLLKDNISADGGYYVHGDFNHWVTYKTRDEAVIFAQRLPIIIEELAKLTEVPEIINPADQ